MNKANISSGRGNTAGCVYIAPVGTTLPTDATTALGEDFTELGYVSDAGLTNSNNPTVTEVKDWSGSVVDILQTDRSDTYAFAFLESTNADVLKTLYGENNVSVDSAGNITVNVKNVEPTPYVWVFEQILKGNKLERIVLPAGMITELGDINYQSDASITFAVTVTATADEQGNYEYRYITA